MEFSNHKVKVICPLCGFVNTMFLGNCSPLPTLIYCCVEDGGCDKPFAFAVEARVEVVVKTAVINLKGQGGDE